MKKIKTLFDSIAKRNIQDKPILIETPRLIIREIEPSDADRLFEIISAPGFFYCYFDGTKDSVDKFVKRAIETGKPAHGNKRSEYLLAVVDKSDGRLIGHVSLESEKLVNDYTHSINFFMDPKRQNKGYGKEAIVNTMRYALEDLSMPGFSVTIHPENKPSLHVAHAEGYKVIGETTLETTRGVEPRLILVLPKDEFYEQRKKDKNPLLLPRPETPKRRFGFFR